MFSTPRLRRLGAVTVCALTFVISGYRSTGFSNAESRAVTRQATTWLKTQQQNDGGFEVAGFPGFETPDAVLAIAEEAQNSPRWSTARAVQAVRNTRKNGRSPLGYLDDLADQPGFNAGQAAKLIVLVVKPLGLSLRDFNPQGDAHSRNLVYWVNRGLEPDGSYGAFNATLYAAIAKRMMGDAVEPTTIAYIRAAQDTDGGWNYTGTANAADSDVDTTALAMQALVAAGVAPNDVNLRDGLEYLARSQRRNGGWQSFGSADPNSTASAIIAITAMGYVPGDACWRNSAAPDLAGRAYKSPIIWLRNQQATDGHIASPNDGFGVNTFATAQSIQALRRAWNPFFTQAEAC